MTQAQQHTACAIESARVHVESIRKCPRFALSEAQQETLYNVECILASLETEIENEA
jgi:hypothetical protein